MSEIYTTNSNVFRLLRNKILELQMYIYINRKVALMFYMLVSNMPIFSIVKTAMKTFIYVCLVALHNLHFPLRDYCYTS